MKKLLYVITRAEFGGAQRAVFELASGFNKRYEITVAAGEPRGSRELIDRCEATGIRTIRLRHLRRAIHPWHDVHAVFELRRLINRERFDLIHAHSSKAGVISALALTPASLKALGWIFRMPRLSERAEASEFRGKKNSAPRLHYIYTAHGWVFQEPLSAPLRLAYLTMEHIAARRRDATIVLSDAEKRAALAHGLGSEANVVVIPNGVRCPPDLLPREEARREIAKFASVDPTSRMVGAVSNLYRTKGIDTLIAAAMSTAERSPDIRFIVIGDGPERERLAADIRARGLTDVVRLIGSVPDAGRLLPAFDLFVLPSRKEGLPFALLDAAAAGVPIAATAVGGIPEVLRDEADALLVPSGDPARLADRILRLLGDRDLSARLASSARDRICTTFRIERMLEQTAALYERLLK